MSKVAPAVDQAINADSNSVLSTDKAPRSLWTLVGFSNTEEGPQDALDECRMIEGQSPGGIFGGYV